MASPLFCHGFLDDLGLHALFGVHLLQAPVLVLQLLQAGHQRSIHAAVLGAPLVERGTADAMLAAQIGRWSAHLRLLENGDDLTVGKF